MSANENDNAPETVPRFEAIDRQQLVLRVDIEELIEPHHPARKYLGVSRPAGLSPFAAEVKSVEEHPGRSAWEPRLLISTWLYGYSRGISSAREIERQCRYEPGLQMADRLAGSEPPYAPCSRRPFRMPCRLASPRENRAAHGKVLWL